MPKLLFICILCLSLIPYGAQAYDNVSINLTTNVIAPSSGGGGGWGWLGFGGGGRPPLTLNDLFPNRITGKEVTPTSVISPCTDLTITDFSIYPDTVTNDMFVHVKFDASSNCKYVGDIPLYFNGNVYKSMHIDLSNFYKQSYGESIATTGLPNGVYSVKLNNMSASFTVASSLGNIVTPTPAASAPVANTMNLDNDVKFWAIVLAVFVVLLIIAFLL